MIDVQQLQKQLSVDIFGVTDVGVLTRIRELITKESEQEPQPIEVVPVDESSVPPPPPWEGMTVDLNRETPTFQEIVRAQNPPRLDFEEYIKLVQEADKHEGPNEPSWEEMVEFLRQ